MALLASGINLNDALKDPLSDIGRNSSGRLETALGRVKGRFNTGSMVSGRPQSQYFDEQIGNAETMGQRGIEDALYGVLGGSSYQQQIAERDHARKMALAKKLGSINSPSTLQEVLGGIGLAGQTLPAFMGGANALYKRYNSGGNASIPQGNLSLFNNNQTGLARYGL